MTYPANTILDYFGNAELCLGIVTKDMQDRMQVCGPTRQVARVLPKQVLCSYGLCTAMTSASLPDAAVSTRTWVLLRRAQIMVRLTCVSSTTSTCASGAWNSSRYALRGAPAWRCSVKLLIGSQ